MVSNSCAEKWSISQKKEVKKAAYLKRIGPAPRFKPPIVYKNPQFKTAVITFKNKARMSWSAENKKKLLDMRKDGKTWGEIAEALGATREAVRKEYKRCSME